MLNANGDIPIGREMYYIILKSYGYTVDKGIITNFYQSTNMYCIKNTRENKEYVVKANRVFRLKVDAIKRCNTIKNFKRDGGCIPSLL